MTLGYWALLAWITPPTLTAFVYYKDMQKGGRLKDFNFEALLVSMIPVVGFMLVLVSIVIAVSTSLWDIIKNIKIK